MANWVKSFLEQNLDKASWPVYKRAKHSLHLVRPDGKIEANFTGAPCHYQDILGDWHELDTKLIAIGSELGAPGLPTRIELDGTVRIEGGTYSHRSTRIGVFNSLTKKFTVAKTIPLGTVQDDKLIAESGVFKRVLTLTETGLREEIIISALPTGLTQLVNDWAVLETAISGVSFPDGWLDDFNADGFMFPPPRTHDTNGNEAPCKRYARTVGGIQYVYTGIPVSWLASAIYPVTIDPDFTESTADGYVGGGNAVYATARSTSAEFNITSEWNLLVGQLATSNYYTYRTFLKFVTSSIPDAADITQVNLKLVCCSDVSATNFIVEVIEQDWSASDPITAENRETVYDACLAAANHIDWYNTATGGFAVNTQYTSSNLTIAYVSKTGNTYYSLRSDRDKAATTPTGYEYLGIAPQEYATEAHRPILTVVYTTTNIKTILGLAVASVKTFNGLLMSSVKSIDGLA